MSHRFFELASGSVLTAVIGTALIAAAPAAAQSQSTALLPKDGARTWTQPKTPDGKPDLSGVYTNASVIPLERPKDLGSKEFFTKEEADAYAAKELSQREVVAPGTYGAVHYNMAQFGIQKRQSKVPTTIRTSLIIGSEGRVPPLLPAAQARVAARQ